VPRKLAETKSKRKLSALAVSEARVEFFKRANTKLRVRNKELAAQVLGLGERLDIAEAV